MVESPFWAQKITFLRSGSDSCVATNPPILAEIPSFSGQHLHFHWPKSTSCVNITIFAQKKSVKSTGVNISKSPSGSTLRPFPQQLSLVSGARANQRPQSR
jgi:hypothetical protein